jgi:hypothetical protein
MFVTKSMSYVCGHVRFSAISAFDISALEYILIFGSWAESPNAETVTHGKYWLIEIIGTVTQSYLVIKSELNSALILR